MESRDKVEFLPRVAEQSFQSPDPQLPGRSGGAMNALAVTPGVAVATIGINLMQDTMTWLTMGLFLFFSFFAAVGLGYYTYETQTHNGDPIGIARAKAVLIFVLTFLPVPLAPVIAGPMGVLGFINKMRRH